MFEHCVEPVEKRLLPYCGMPVCLFMKDGSRIVGRLTACRKGAVILNGDSLRKQATAAARSTSGRRGKRTKIQSRKRGQQPTATGNAMPAPLAPFSPFGPLSLEPPSWDAAKPDQVPLRAIDSVLIL